MSRWEAHGSKAILHDVNLGLPLEFEDAAVIYSEIPWKDGYEEFLRRARKPVDIQPSYEKWLFRLSETLMRDGRPFILVGGHAMVRYVGCEWVHPLTLNGSLACAIGARCPAPHEKTKTSDDLIRKLALRYASVLDPCAGYGNVCKAFAELGKRFFATDINSSCIGYIAAEAQGWFHGA